jgi:3-hydroxyacyl-CoA dehydrogenase
MTLVSTRSWTLVSFIIAANAHRSLADNDSIEQHYADERGNLPEEPRQLLKEYIAKGWLGKKSGRGFYDYST